MRNKIRICHSVLADYGSAPQGGALGPDFCPERSRQLHLIMRQYFAEQHVPAMGPQLSAAGPGKHSRPLTTPRCSPSGGADTKAKPTPGGAQTEADAETGTGLGTRDVATVASTNFAGQADRGATERGSSAIPLTAQRCDTDAESKKDDEAGHIGARIPMAADCSCDSGLVATDAVLGKQPPPPDTADRKVQCCRTSPPSTHHL